MRWSRKSSTPVSAYSASSISSTTASPRQALKTSRHPANSSSRDSAAPPSPRRRPEQPTRTPPTYARYPNERRTGPPRRPASPPPSVVPSAVPSRCRTISAQRPDARPCRATGTSPGPAGCSPRGHGHLFDSQPSRDFPTPAGPDPNQPRHPAVRSRVEQLPDRAQLRVPAGQRRLQPIHPLDAAHRRQHPGRPPQPHRLRLALQPVLPGIGEPDRGARQTLRRHVGQHLPRLGRRLYPGRGVDRISGHHPLAHRAQSDGHLA